MTSTSITVTSVPADEPMRPTPDSEIHDSETVARRRASLWRRVISGGIWVVVARFLGIASTVLANYLLARQLAEAFGQFVVLCSIMNAASLVAIFGMSSGVVRFVAEQLAHDNRARARQVLRICFRLAACSTVVTTMVVLVGMSVSGSHYLSLPQPILIAVIMASVLATQAFSNLNAAALRGLGEMRYSSMVGGQGGAVGPMANTLFLVLVAGLACVTQLSLVGVLFAYLAAFGITLIVGSCWLSRTVVLILGPRGLCTKRGSDPQPHEPPTNASHNGKGSDPVFVQSRPRDSNRIAVESAPLAASTILAACLPMLLVQILSTVSKQGSLWVAGAACSPEDLALYAGANRAIQLVVMPLSLVNLSVMAFIPQLRMQGRLGDLERVLRVSAGWAAIPSFLVLMAFVLAPASILGIFLGSNYRSAAGLLSILSIGQFALVWVGSSELTLVLSGHARTAAMINGIGAGTILIGGPLIARSHGTSGLAVLAAVVITGQCLTQWLLTRYLIGIWTNAVLFPWRIPKDRP